MTASSDGGLTWPPPGLPASNERLTQEEIQTRAYPDYGALSFEDMGQSGAELWAI